MTGNPEVMGPNSISVGLCANSLFFAESQMTLRVARLAAEGMRNREIALKLNLAKHTVRNYLLRIFDKLGISSRATLVLYALSGTNDVGFSSRSSAGSAGLIA